MVSPDEAASLLEDRFDTSALFTGISRAGQNATRVLYEQQNVTEANAQDATLSRMNKAASMAPQTDDELMAKLRDRKEDQ